MGHSRHGKQTVSAARRRGAGRNSPSMSVGRLKRAPSTAVPAVPLPLRGRIGEDGVMFPPNFGEKPVPARWPDGF